VFLDYIHSLPYAGIIQFKFYGISNNVLSQPTSKMYLALREMNPTYT